MCEWLQTSGMNRWNSTVLAVYISIVMVFGFSFNWTTILPADPNVTAGMYEFNLTGNELKIIISEEFLMLTNEASFSVHIPAIPWGSAVPLSIWQVVLDNFHFVGEQAGPGCGGMWCSGEVEGHNCSQGSCCRAGLWPLLLLPGFAVQAQPHLVGKTVAVGSHLSDWNQQDSPHPTPQTELLALWEPLLL